MTCIRIPDGYICVSSGPNEVDLKPYGWAGNMDFDKRFGPLFYRRSGKEIPNPTPKMWSAFYAWFEEYKTKGVNNE